MHSRDELDLLDQVQVEAELMAGDADRVDGMPRRDFVFLTLVSAAAEGRRAFLAADCEDMRALLGRFPDAILAGELEGTGNGEFVVPDGPCALARTAADQRPLLLVSPPGTALIVNAVEGGGTVFLASLLASSIAGSWTAGGIDLTPSSASKITFAFFMFWSLFLSGL